jgi:hypothetical protein
MTQEDKELLLKDLCEKLPYKTYVKTEKGIGYVYAINTSQLIEISVANESEYWSEVFNIDKIKPYLRPMSSMTEEEKIDYRAFFNYDGVEYPEEYIDWLNKHYFDYRGLIEKGLAIEAPDDMYKIKDK